MNLSAGQLEAIHVLLGTIVAVAVITPLARHAPRRHIDHPRRWVAVMAIVAFACYASVALLKLNAYNMGAEDLGRVDQAIWNVLNGKLLVFSASELGRDMSRLAGHVELLYILLAPLFWLWDSAAVLLLAQAALVAAGAWPAFALGRQIASDDGTGNELGVAAAFAYLSHPAVGFATLSDVHGDTLAMPLLMLALERGMSGKRWSCFIATALAVSAKEYVAALAVTMGLYWILAQRDRRLGAACVALGLTWATVVVPAFHSRYRPHDFPDLTPVYYGKFGDTPQEVVVTALTDPMLVLRELVTPHKVATVGLLLAPLAFAPLAAPIVPALAVPVFAPLVATQHLDLRNHHNATLVPFLLVGALLGARRLAGRGAAIVLVATSAIVHFSIGPSPLSIRSWSIGRWDYLLNPHVAGRTAHDTILDEILETIPADARVTASGHLVPHLSHRPVCFAFPAPADSTAIDWAIVDLVGGYPPHYRPRASAIARMRELLDDGFLLEQARDGVFVLRRPAPDDDLASMTRRSPGRTGASANSDIPSVPRRELCRVAALGPLRVARTEDGSVLWLNEDPATPRIVLEATTREVLTAPSVPFARPDSTTILDPSPLVRGRLIVLELHEGYPAIDPRLPPQPWLPSPIVGERLFDDSFECRKNP